jgi:hypothetical protein
MKFFSSPFNQTTCGKIKLPAGNTGKMKLLLVDKDNNKCSVNFLHNFDVQLSDSAFFSTATSIINCDITPDHFVIYLEENNTYSWILENSIQVNIYDLTTGALLATKVFGTLDDLILLEPSNFIDKPSLVLSKCGYDSTINLNKSFIKVEFTSLCGDSVLPACCDQLPESVSISGYDILCIPLRENYEVPDFTTTTTTLPPQEDKIKILQQPYIIQSRDVAKYYLYAFIDTKYGNDFQYWWERSEDNAKWERITELKSSRAFSQISLEQVKEKDYFYRLYIHAPTSKISDSVFYDYIDYATTTTTTTTTTTIPPLPLSPPSQPLNFEVSGGGFRQTFLTWNEPDYDGRSDRTKYGLNITLHQQDTLAYSVDIPPSSTSWYQDIESEYDGILLDYSLRAYNFFGYSPAATVTGIKTLLLAPPTVVNFSVSAQQDPYRMELDWDTTGVNENYPLLGHTVKYRPSGSSSAHTVSSYNGTETQLTILDSNIFDNCETYEFEVTASNSIGESNPASGYARMGFLPSAPVNLDRQITDVGGGNIDLDFYWNPPTDSGRCEILNYVYHYRDASDLNWSPPITVYTTGIQVDSQPSGDYVFKVAAVNVVGTGNYAYYGDWLLVGNPLVITKGSLVGSLAVTDDLHTIAAYDGGNNEVNIYNFNGCDWILNTSLDTGSRFSFANNNSSIATYDESYGVIKVYNNTNDIWSLSSTNSISLSYSTDEGVFSHSDDLSYIIGGTSQSVSLHRLVGSSYQSMGLGSYLPSSPGWYIYYVSNAGISADGSRLAIYGYGRNISLGYEDDFTLRIFDIVGDSLELSAAFQFGSIYDDPYLGEWHMKFSDDSNTLTVDYSDSGYTYFVGRYQYDVASNSWTSVLSGVILPAVPPALESSHSHDGSHGPICTSKDGNTVCFPSNIFQYDSELGPVDALEVIQCWNVSGDSITYKGSPFIPVNRDVPGFTSGRTNASMSDNGNALIFRIGNVASVYRYAAADIELPPCVPTTTPAPTTTPTTTTTPAPSTTLV